MFTDSWVRFGEFGGHWVGGWFHPDYNATLWPNRWVWMGLANRAECGNYIALKSSKFVGDAGHNVRI